MDNSSPGHSTPKSHLDEISTRWAAVNDPIKFVNRYAPAILNYLVAIIGNRLDAEDVSQDFLTNVIARGFANVDPDRGRFRKYLKTAVRNAALMFFRRKHSEQKALAEYERQLREGSAAHDVDRQWESTWTQCVLDRAWTALHQRERRAGDNSFYTVLRASVDHPDEDSAALAARVSASLGRTIQPDNLRKQLSRARRAFAELLIEEVAQTIQGRSPAAIKDELAQTGLMPYVRDFLPTDWNE
jgi:RNA polymerase sigma factor (sigma-70 family)